MGQAAGSYCSRALAKPPLIRASTADKVFDLSVPCRDKAQKKSMQRRPSFSRSAPFQLRVLETALHMATQELAQSVKELLATADQPLQSLATTVSNGLGCGCLCPLSPYTI